MNQKVPYWQIQMNKDALNRTGLNSTLNGNFTFHINEETGALVIDKKK